MAKPVYTLQDGRSILRDGKPFVHIVRSEGNANYHFGPSEADEFARAIVDAMNGIRPEHSASEVRRIRFTKEGKP